MKISLLPERGATRPKTLMVRLSNHKHGIQNLLRHVVPELERVEQMAECLSEQVN